MPVNTLNGNSIPVVTNPTTVEVENQSETTLTFEPDGIVSTS